MESRVRRLAARIPLVRQLAETMRRADLLESRVDQAEAAARRLADEVQRLNEALSVSRDEVRKAAAEGGEGLRALHEALEARRKRDEAALRAVASRADERLEALEAAMWHVQQRHDRLAASLTDGLPDTSAEAARQDDLRARFAAEAGTLERRRLRAAGDSSLHAPVPLGAAVLARQLGHPIRVSSADRIMTPTILRQGAWAPTELGLLLPLLRPGDGVVDVGANIGCHAVPFAHAVGPTGTVLAIEPDPACVQLLLGNLQLGGLENVEVLVAACSDREGVLRLHLDRRNLGATSALRTSMDNVDNTFEVPAVTLDALQARHWLPSRLRLVKMDLQGYEPAVVDGMRHVLEGERPIVLCEYDSALLARSGQDGARLAGRFEALGYRLFEVSDVTRDVRRTSSGLLSVPRGAERLDTNLLCIPAEDASAVAQVEPLCAA